MNLLMRLVGEAARSLGTAADVAIIERHHRTKKDAPSGTALRLAECAPGTGSRSASQPSDGSASEISMHALRVADSPGEHTVIFAMLGETLELSHRALNRDGFARGALDAAKFLAGKPAGCTRWRMYSVLRIVQSCKIEIGLVPRHGIGWSYPVTRRIVPASRDRSAAPARCRQMRMNMAGCERGYLCAVCGQEVEEITESDLYLRYVLGEVEWERAESLARAAHPL